MFLNEMEFRVLTKALTIAECKNISKILIDAGFEIIDLLEANVVMTKDGSIINKVYIFCCKGATVDFLEFESQNKYEEINYEVVRTLM